MPLQDRVSENVRQKLIEIQEVNEPTIEAGDFNTSLSEPDRPSRQKIAKNIAELNDITILM